MEANVSPDAVPEVNLSEFATLIGLEQIASGRYSVLLAANLLGGALSGVQKPAKIVHEIELLEKMNWVSSSNRSRTVTHRLRASGISTTCRTG
ncbi:hypothetical protein [Pseudomonas sp. W2-17]|uniref:hypothetical protein n=1 Tax=Pseudomonas sp. W2-17 TaxID=3058039 RepID=UPI0034E08F49